MPVRLVTLFVLLVALPVSAQEATPDTTAPWRYFPLAVGDLWQYEVEVDGPFHPYMYLMEREVIGDTLLDERRYAVVEERNQEVDSTITPYPPPDTSYQFVRFDTLAATPFYWQGSASETPVAGGCRFDEAFPANPEEPRDIECPAVANAQVLGGYKQERTIADRPYDVYWLTVKGFTYFGGSGVA